MKLLVFAHTPPPHHGQSYMVKLMLDGFGGDCAPANGAVAGRSASNVTTSTRGFRRALEDIGEFQGAKILLIFWFIVCRRSGCRFRHGVKNFYYVPAPGKRVALYRDWLVMLLCRPFFKKIILHWHAAGLAKWLETSSSISSRATTYRLFRAGGFEHRAFALQFCRRGKAAVAAASAWSTTAFRIPARILTADLRAAGWRVCAPAKDLCRRKSRPRRR